MRQTLVLASGRVISVIAISHDMRFVAETFQRIVVMGAGRVLLDGTPAGSCSGAVFCRG